MLEMIRDLIIIVSGIAGSVFAVYKYRKSREAEGALQVELATEIHENGGRNLVDVSIKLINVGKAASIISGDVYRDALLMVRKVPCPVKDEAIRWEQLEDQKIIRDVQFMDIYGSVHGKNAFIFEPNTTDVYTVCFSTNYSGAIWVRARVIDRRKFAWIADKIVILPSRQAHDEVADIS